MIDRHKKEIEETKKDLDVQLSPKVKETSELLNLRKMEEHMVKQKMYFILYLASQKPIKFSNRSLRWREKRRKIGWTKDMRECRQLSIPSSPNRPQSWETSDKSTRTCLTSQSEIAKLKRRDCIRNSKICTETWRTSRIRKFSTIRDNSGPEEEETHLRGQEVTSNPDLNRYHKHNLRQISKWFLTEKLFWMWFLRWIIRILFAIE